MAALTNQSDDRIERERAFHDDRFDDDSARAAAGRFYDLAVGASGDYAKALDDAPAGARALEYGAGTGGAGFSLAERGVLVSGIDISPVAVAKANDEAAARGLTPATCHYEVMDAEQLTYEDDTFDLVFGSGILHHLDLDASLAQIARVLKPGGTAVFFEPLGHNPAINLYRRLTPAMRTPDEHPLLASDIAGADRWFGSVDGTYHVLSTFAAVPFRRFASYSKLISRLNRADQALLRRVPAVERFAWIVVLRLGDPRPGTAG